jgi:hypothetical protein
MGCYPLLACADWSVLANDLGAGHPWTTLVAVTDPFGPGATDLRAAFPDLCRPYKEHFVTDLTRPPAEFVDPHHLRNATRARRAVTVHRGEPTPQLLGTWCALYRALIAKHSITGIAAFSDESFARQFRVPGLVVQWGEIDGQIAGMVLWYVIGDRAYYHLGAYSATGYDARCSFALFVDAIEWFPTRGVRWLALGAGAGAVNDTTDGLTRFKRGWATGTRSVYLCGRVFDRDRYRALCALRGVPPDGAYFPAYRTGEFG